MAQHMGAFQNSLDNSLTSLKGVSQSTDHSSFHVLFHSRVCTSRNPSVLEVHRRQKIHLKLGLKPHL